MAGAGALLRVYPGSVGLPTCQEASLPLLGFLISILAWSAALRERERDGLVLEVRRQLDKVRRNRDCVLPVLAERF